jgi:hypothetical protein
MSTLGPVLLDLNDHLDLNGDAHRQAAHPYGRSRVASTFA